MKKEFEKKTQEMVKVFQAGLFKKTYEKDMLMDYDCWISNICTDLII